MLFEAPRGSELRPWLRRTTGVELAGAQSRPVPAGSLRTALSKQLPRCFPSAQTWGFFFFTCSLNSALQTTVCCWSPWRGKSSVRGGERASVSRGLRSFLGKQRLNTPVVSDLHRRSHCQQVLLVTSGLLEVITLTRVCWPCSIKFLCHVATF